MKKKLIVAMIVFTAIGAGIFYVLTTGNIGTKYNTVEVKKGEVQSYVEDVGTISSKTIRRYYGMGTHKVKEMTLALGERVTKGQLLIQYEDTLELEIKRIQKQIEGLRAAYREAVEGADQARVSSAKLEISSVESDLALAVKKKEDTQVLYNSGAVSLSELEQAAHSVTQLENRLAIAKNTYSQLVKGASVNTRKRYEAEIEAMQLTLEMIKEEKETYRVYADLDGIVTELNTYVGDQPSPGTMIVEIQDPSAKVLLVDFLVEDARQIKPGMKVEVSDPQLGVRLDNLKVDKIHPKAFRALSELGVEENRQPVEISLPATSDELAYGLELDIKVIIETSSDALVIPKGAVYQRDSKTYVEVLEGKKPVEREITTGIELNNEIEVKEGLSEGDLVILNYQEN